MPLLEYYAGREWMFTVDGAQPAEAVHEDIVARLAKLDGLATRLQRAAEAVPARGSTGDGPSSGEQMP